MRNILIKIEYEGTNYCGWQVQNNGISIQQKIEEALFDVTGETIRINGSGRTDAGVHALGQTASFVTSCTIPAENISKSLNPRLPSDISIVSSEEVPVDFHARFSAKGKTYRYLIFNRQQRSPFWENKAYRYGKTINVPEMQKAAAQFIGTHDFRAFMASGSSVENTVRAIEQLSVVRERELISLEIMGNGFLYNMVRIIAGTLLECGTGKRTPGEIPGIVSGLDRKRAGRTLPGYGLYLVKVLY